MVLLWLPCLVKCRQTDQPNRPAVIGCTDRSARLVWLLAQCLLFYSVWRHSIDQNFQSIWNGLISSQHLELTQELNVHLCFMHFSRTCLPCQRQSLPEKRLSYHQTRSPNFNLLSLTSTSLCTSRSVFIRSLSENVMSVMCDSLTLNVLSIIIYSTKSFAFLVGSVLVLGMCYILSCCILLMHPVTPRVLVKAFRICLVDVAVLSTRQMSNV